MTSLKAVDEVRNNSSGNEFLLVLSRRSTLPESTLNLHQGKKIGKVNISFIRLNISSYVYLYDLVRITIIITLKVDLEPNVISSILI